MKVRNEGAWATSGADMLPRSIGVSIAAFGALLCWAGVIGVVQVLN